MTCYNYCLILIGLLIYARRIYGQLAINVPAVGNYGEETHMNCTEASFNIANGYTWLKDNIKVYDNINGDATSTGKYTSTHGAESFTLTLTNTALDDDGIYTCNYNFNQQSANMEIQAKGNVTAKLSSSSGKLEVTFQKIYPSEISVVITCDSSRANGAFVTNVTDETFYTRKWESSTVFSSKPSACSVAVTLRTTFSIDFDVISASTEAPTTVPRTDETSDTDAIVGGTVGGVLGFGGLVAVAVVGIRHLNNKKKGNTTILSIVEGGKVTFSCPFPESVTFPEWRGPPGLTIYTSSDDTLGRINSKIPAFNRLQYASNKRDLILSDAVISDSGDYRCSYTGQGDHTITLKVNRGKGDQASNVVNAGSHRPGRPQPPPPSGANSNHSKLPDIHDRKGRGLSANLGDDDHPLVYINTPAQRADALESIPDSAKRKKKKRKKRVDTEDDQSD